MLLQTRIHIHIAEPPQLSLPNFICQHCCWTKTNKRLVRPHVVCFINANLSKIELVIDCAISQDCHIKKPTFVSRERRSTPRVASAILFMISRLRTTAWTATAHGHPARRNVSAHRQKPDWSVWQFVNFCTFHQRTYLCLLPHLCLDHIMQRHVICTYINYMYIHSYMNSTCTSS